ncbi:hypothetical protein A2851_04985 [Candidatus Kaiserbacteria bacterium RIFCSPHIGHO2_01_FULL_53_29]|uniref:Cache domain-containing protein n=1 Tax=Candidatus Kaiserbacteria bacterium RIFCSPHIGHO2_01_FULL_53_29 TaxID=1798480 RepID=A0A1F6CT75_9BACT|nr:MAG: hypothetical protein A2851_04985 [Candidatus Kaiserbacteria bacterium RIFCSPHIGHO2_01_FULL_53_29]
MNIDTRLVALVVLVLGIVGFGTYLWISPSPSATTSALPTTQPRIELSPEVEAVLAQKMAILEGLSRENVVLADVMISNNNNRALAQTDIKRLDDEWQTSEGVTPFIQQFLSNDSARRLLAFQKEYPGFKEIFVTDMYGLNVSQTDKTSDYYQADEAWWQNSFNGGAGEKLHGQIEFDESSQTEAISLYVPIIDTSSKAIGVLKGVLDLAVIKREL